MGKEQGLSGGQNKSIKTDGLTIKGNIMTWEGTMIQLVNISYITVNRLESLRFPWIALLLLWVGVVNLKSSALWAAILAVAGAAWIVWWFYVNGQRSKEKVLSISMNSGMNLHFLFYNQSFLDEVLRVLEQIILEGGIGEHDNVKIDISNCTLSGHARILDNFTQYKEGKLF